MKGKAKKTTTKKDTGAKVFDVMRPGKNTVPATSRPVIVGHKPQVKDPMMAERKDNDEERALLDSTQKVTIQPTTAPALKSDPTPPASPDAPTPPTTADTPAEGTLKKDTQSAAADVEPPTMASVVTQHALQPEAEPATTTPESNDIEQSAADFLADAGQADTPKAVPQPPTLESEPEVSATEAKTPTEPAPSAPAPAPDTVGAIFAQPPAPTEPVKPPGNIEPLPVLPDEPTPQPIIVAHHSHKSGGAGKIVLILFLVLIFAAIIFDILLDAGFVVLEGIPHTDFF